jgi:hypothetical protein
MGPQILGPIDHPRLEDGVVNGELLKHIEAVDHVAEGGIAAIHQVETGGGELRLVEEEEELRRAIVEQVAKGSTGSAL